MADKTIYELLNVRAPMPDLDDQEKDLNEEQSYIYEPDDYEDEDEDEDEDEENDVDYDNYDEDIFDEDDEDESSSPSTSEEAERIMEHMSEVLNRIENTESIMSNEALESQPRIRPHFTPAPRFVPPQRGVLNALFRETLPEPPTEPPTEAPTEAPRSSSNLEPLTNPNVNEAISSLIVTADTISNKEFTPLERTLINTDINNIYNSCKDLQLYVENPTVGVPSELD